MDPSSTGGISTLTRNVEKGLKQRGHEVQTLFIPFELSERDWEILDYVPRPRWCYSVKSIKTRRFAYLQNVYSQARSVISTFDPDIVHAMHIWNWPAVIVANELKIPTVLSTHALELEEKSLAARAIDDADVIHSVSSFTRNLVADVADNEVDSTYIAPPSIEVSKYQSEDCHIRSGSEVVITLSRLVDRKNIGTVIKSWEHIDTKSTDRELIVAGSGPNQESLAALVEDRNDISIVGGISEKYKRELLAKADVFALVPSRNGFDVEGFGIVYVEAQAANTPVVGSSYGGVPEAVGDGGIIVDQEDDPTEVANATTQLLSNQEVQQRCLSAIDHRIEQFGLLPVTEKHLEVYRGLLGKTNTSY